MKFLFLFLNYLLLFAVYKIWGITCLHGQYELINNERIYITEVIIILGILKNYREFYNVTDLDFS